MDFASIFYCSTFCSLLVLLSRMKNRIYGWIFNCFKFLWCNITGGLWRCCSRYCWDSYATTRSSFHHRWQFKSNRLCQCWLPVYWPNRKVGGKIYCCFNWCHKSRWVIFNKLNEHITCIENVYFKKVMKKLEEIYGNVYSTKNVLLSGTHTHSGPGILAVFPVHHNEQRIQQADFVQPCRRHCYGEVWSKV